MGQILSCFGVEMKTKPKRTPVRPLNILLTNGRFPVALDLARQLKRVGHTIFVVDPMHYHVCKFSKVVKKSFRVPAPHDDAAGYIAGVKNAVKEKEIDLIIPLHEEIFYLAECEDGEILDRLFAPPFDNLVRLHDKWEFSQFLKRLGLDFPHSILCRTYEDVQKLDHSKEWALKPVFGRAASNVFHLKPDKPLPTADEVAIDEENLYIAQEWLYGLRYCSYSVLRDGQLRLLSVYPVKDTIDGSSCVYFESAEHQGIRDYVEKIAAAHPGVRGQLAFDFIETEEGRLVAIECNPRATSGVHLYSGHKDLGRCITDPAMAAGELLIPKNGASRQVAPGMLMVPHSSHANAKEYLLHLKRLAKSRDVTFNWNDVLPSLMQPFLLTSYYEICREKGGIKVKDMFQLDMVWEPRGEHLERVRRMLKETKETEGRPQDGNDLIEGDERNALTSEVEKKMSHDDVGAGGKDLQTNGMTNEVAVQS